MDKWGRSPLIGCADPFGRVQSKCEMRHAACANAYSWPGDTCWPPQPALIWLGVSSHRLLPVEAGCWLIECTKSHPPHPPGVGVGVGVKSLTNGAQAKATSNQAGTSCQWNWSWSRSRALAYGQQVKLMTAHQFGWRWRWRDNPGNGQHTTLHGVWQEPAGSRQEAEDWGKHANKWSKLARGQHLKVTFACEHNPCVCVCVWKGLLSLRP